MILDSRVHLRIDTSLGSSLWPCVTMREQKKREKNDSGKQKSDKARKIPRKRPRGVQIPSGSPGPGLPSKGAEGCLGGGSAERRVQRVERTTTPRSSRAGILGVVVYLRTDARPPHPVEPKVELWFSQFQVNPGGRVSTVLVKRSRFTIY